ncbi:MAG: protein-disulfide reductase DsbD domain-containing protein [Phycisphaerales bacterium]
MIHQIAALLSMLSVGPAGSTPGTPPASPGAPKPPTSPSAEKQPHPLRASLVAESATVQPGGTVWLAVVLEMEPGWHTYWPGENDTGAPIKLHWTLPAGWSVGDVLWPAPDRYVGDGDLLDYVLEGQRGLLVPLKAPAGAKDGEKATLSLDIRWLVCKSACIPGSAQLSVVLATGPAEPVQTQNSTVFAAARSRVPQPLAAATDRVKAAWSGDSVIFSATDAASLAFSVGAGSALVPQAFKHGAATGGTLNLPVDTTDPERKALRGVLEVRPAKGHAPIFYSVDMAKP